MTAGNLRCCSYGQEQIEEFGGTVADGAQASRSGQDDSCQSVFWSKSLRTLASNPALPLGTTRPKVFIDLPDLVGEVGRNIEDCLRAAATAFESMASSYPGPSGDGRSGRRRRGFSA